MAAQLNRPCPGCGRDVPTHLFACTPCWRRLPRDLQAPIVDTWRRVLAGEPWPAERQEAVEDARHWYQESATAAGGAR